MTPISETPCSKCGGRCHLMAGQNVAKRFADIKVLVCWECRLARPLARTWKHDRK